MAKKGERRQAIDPAVAVLLEDLTHRERRRSMSKRERAAHDKAQRRLARRVNWDLPPALKERIKRLASAEEIPESQLAAWLLLRGLAGLDDEALTEELAAHKEPSRSPRYAWNLRLNEDEEGES